MERLETRLDGPILIAPRVIGDERGFFCETYRAQRFAELGIPEEMVQDNHSRSRHGDRAGHALSDRAGGGQARALRSRSDLRRRRRPARGLADLRPVGGLPPDRGEHAHASTARSGSPMASACSARSRTCMYKQSNYYADETERGIAYDDPDVGIDWPLPTEELIPPRATPGAAPDRDRRLAAFRVRGGIGLIKSLPGPRPGPCNTDRALSANSTSPERARPPNSQGPARQSASRVPIHAVDARDPLRAGPAHRSTGGE